MIPEQVPVFRAKDMLVNADEFRIGRKATILGWIKELFLYGNDYEGIMLSISDKDRKEFEQAEKAVREAAGIHRQEPLVFWECTISADKAAKVLNKAMKTMGYTEIYDA